MLWDLFCRVVDNHGDIGVCWRAAADLASRGEQVQLWLDDASALAWMAPYGRAGVQVLPWTDEPPALAPGDVVVEAFGCNPPDAFVARMARSPRPPVWINLEYLSAEDYVERSHGLPSPQPSGPGAGLVKWFYYPGFTRRTGGLLREPDLMQLQSRFDGDAWLARHGLARRAGERVVSLFCYANAALPGLIDALSEQSTLLLAAAGTASDQMTAELGPSLARGGLRALLLPYLTQADFDRLLWACDLNFVRGEDSFVRAQWAGKPFVWQIYPQDDGAHAVKLLAFLDLFFADAPPAETTEVRRLWQAWNGLSAGSLQLPPRAPSHASAKAWRERLLAQPDLITQLMGFVAERR